MQVPLFEIFSTSVSDFFSKPILLRLLGVLIVSLILVYMSGYYLFDYLYTLTATIEGEQYSASTVANDMSSNIESIPYIGVVLAFIIAKVAFVILSIASVLIGSYITIIFSLIIAGLLTPGIVRLIVLKRGGSMDEISGFGNVFTGIGKVLLIFAIHLFIFILIIPLLLIPVFNVIVLTIVVYSFFRHILVYDVGSNMLNLKMYKQHTGFWDRDLLLITVAGFALSSIPIIGIFSSVFVSIVLVNYFYKKKLFLQG
jgi:hypothetical protein